jgi:LPS-assembly lipoprotein
MNPLFRRSLTLALLTRRVKRLGPRLRGDDEPARQSRGARALLALALLGGLVACGFHPRGVAGLPFAKMYVAGNGADPTVAQIKQTIGTYSGTKVVPRSEDADANLQIVHEEREKIISALNTAGKVREYELRLIVVFRLTDNKANELIAPNEIRLFRLMTYNDTEVLSKGEEEALLYRDMLNDIVQQILRRVAAAKPYSAG